MLISNHGGSCCGVKHLHSFHSPLNFAAGDMGQLREMVSRVKKGISIEVVLTDTQSALWAPSLVKIGFKPVFRFRNSNSGNRLTVFFYHPRPLSLENLPFSTNPGDAPKINGRLRRYPTVGDRVRVLNPNAEWHGRSVTVVSVDEARGCIKVRYQPTRATRYFRLGSLGK